MAHPIERLFGDKMREARDAAAMTQAAVASALNVSQPTVSSWENGGAFPTIRNLSRFCTLTGADLTSLVEALAEAQAVPA